MFTLQFFIFSLYFSIYVIKIVDFLCYKLYDLYMNDFRLTFFSPTNISLPFTIYQTLEEDARRFNFIKNGIPNISGLLNHLIPCLSNYRQDLHNNFLEANNNDEEFVKKLEENLYKKYLPADYPIEDIITYQWNQSREDNFKGHFNFYYCITRNSVSKGSMLLYMILLLSIGVVGDFVSNAVHTLFGLFS